MLVLQLLQVELVDLPEDQQLPVQELHLLLDRLAVGELAKAQTGGVKVRPQRRMHAWHGDPLGARHPSAASMVGPQDLRRRSCVQNHHSGVVRSGGMKPREKSPVLG